MEHTSGTVAEGRLIGQTSYSDRARKYTEFTIEGVKIDFYDAKNNVVREVKKSDKLEFAHVAQVRYYLAVLHRNGFGKPGGILEYPRLKHTHQIPWDDQIPDDSFHWEQRAIDIIKSDVCPPLAKKGICKNCAYYELCYIGEEY